MISQQTNQQRETSLRHRWHASYDEVLLQHIIADNVTARSTRHVVIYLVSSSTNLIVIHGHTADRIAFNSRILFRDDLTTQCAHVCIVVCSCDATSTAAVGQRCCADNVVYLNVILQRACSDTMPLTPHPPYIMLWYYETSSHHASAMITSCDSLLLLGRVSPKLS